MDKHDEIRERLNKVSRKWGVGIQDEEKNDSFLVCTDKHGKAGFGIFGSDDAVFFAHAPEYITFLLAEVERLQAEIDRLNYLHTIRK